MKAFYSLLLLLAVALTSCDEVLGTQGQIELADGTSTSLVLSADENLEATIKFTAESSWTASVNELAVSKSSDGVSWLTLSGYSGEAGENTITISLIKNYTCVSRKAEIKIVCGDSEVVITVEQKGEAASGNIAKQVKQIIYTVIENSDVDLGNDHRDDGYTMSYSYDEEGRVARIKKDGTEYYGDEYTSTIEFDYGIVNEIQVIKETIFKNSGAENVRYLVELDNRGNAVRLEKKEEGEAFTEIAKFGYTEDARLGKIEYNDYGWETDLFTYKDGLMSEYTHIPTYGDSETYKFDSYYSLKNPNNCMIDMMGFLNYGTEFEYLFHIGRLGKTSDYFLEALPEDYAESDINIPSEGFTADQNGTKHTYKSIDWSDEPTQIKCEYDTEGNLIKVEQSHSYELIEKSYTIKVYTDEEPIRIDENGIKYYRGDYIYEPDKKLKEDFDYYTFTINY